MNVGLKQSVMICNHVFDGAAILEAIRDIPLESDDSGWQCHCNKVDHTQETSAKFISIQELLDIEPSLRRWINSPIGTTLQRDAPSKEWKSK